VHAPLLKSAIEIADRHSRILASALHDLDPVEAARTIVDLWSRLLARLAAHPVLRTALE